MIHVRTSALLMVAALAACGGAVNTTPIGSSVRATPSPPAGVSTPTPPPGPAGVLQAGPATLAFATATSAAQNIAVSETAYTGAFMETTTCASIATVTTTSAAGPQASFTVTPAAGGTCAVTFADATNQTATVAVAVTTSALDVTSTGRGGAQ
jgi:hypothetical protein